MTEEEWLSCNEPEPMLECLVTERFPDAEPCNWGRGERKKRLFICACVHRIWDLLPAEYKAVVEMLEPDVDVQVSDEARQAKWSAAERISWAHSNLLFAIGYDDIGLLCHVAAGATVAAVSEKSGTEARLRREHREQSSLLHDIFGNPFRPVAVDPSWRTPATVGLASYIYEERAFSRMPDLALILEARGCSDADILDHCRQSNEHVRGCWVLDLLLGKE